MSAMSPSTVNSRRSSAAGPRSAETGSISDACQSPASRPRSTTAGSLQSDTDPSAPITRTRTARASRGRNGAAGHGTSTDAPDVTRKPSSPTASSYAACCQSGKTATCHDSRGAASPMPSASRWCSKRTGDSSSTPLLLDKPSVDGGARLGSARERLPVDREQPELPLVAEDPLEVVHQRPVVVAEHRHAVGDRLAQPAQRRLDERRTLAVVVGLHAVLGDEYRLACHLVGVPGAAAERGWVAAAHRPPGGRRPVGVDRPRGVVVKPLVILDGDEVILAGQLKPALVDLGPLAVAQARVVPVYLVVDDGDGEADRQVRAS